MAIDKLELYNNALQLVGQRRLTSVTDNENTRHYLDAAYNAQAVDYCLELSKPTFATKTVKLTTSSESDEHDLDNVFTLPDSYITVVEVFSDPRLDQPVSRYILEGNTIACEHETIYLRYITDEYSDTYTYWTPTFTKLASAYLAKEICPKLAPTHLETISILFDERLKTILEEEEGRRPTAKSVASDVTLTSAWMDIYNDALLVMGLDEITSANDDSNRRAKLDRALNAGIVAELLEDTDWTFGLSSYESTYNPNLEPEWGYTRVHDQPEKLHSLSKIYTDEMMQNSLRDYKSEDDKYFCSLDVIYIEFVSTDFLHNPNQWPTFFKRLIAARMARDASPSLVDEGADVGNSVAVFDERHSNALNNDAVTSPPKRIPQGSWTKARGSNRNYRA